MNKFLEEESNTIPNNSNTIKTESKPIVTN